MMGRLLRSRIEVRFRAAMVLVSVAGALCLPLVARGADGASRRAEAKAEVERAEVQYKLGRFDEALEGYSRAYELVNAPGLLFDIGQCHRNLKSYERAIFFFEGYLREETRPERRALANQLIAESRSELEKQRQRPAEADDGASPGTAAETVPSWREAPSIADAPSPAVSASGSIASGGAPAAVPLTQKWWFWTAVGVGVLAIAAGAVAIVGSADTVLPAGSVGTLDGRR
jgi:tetratricopeptide (TPR) repeat protein